MFGKSRMMLAAVWCIAAVGSALAVAPKMLSKTIAPSATIGSSRPRLSAIGKRKGITTAQQKRATLKKRNQARHKAAVRG